MQKLKGLLNAGLTLQLAIGVVQSCYFSKPKHRKVARSASIGKSSKLVEKTGKLFLSEALLRPDTRVSNRTRKFVLRMSHGLRQWLLFKLIELFVQIPRQPGMRFTYSLTKTPGSTAISPDKCLVRVVTVHPEHDIDAVWHKPGLIVQNDVFCSDLLTALQKRVSFERSKCPG